MKKNYLLTLLLALLFAFMPQFTWAQAPVDSPEQAITGLLNRIGGNGAADKFEIVIDASLAENGKDVFVITSQDGKPCIKGNTQLSVATGINWYLNHYAHINLTWNNLTTDLSQVTLPVPAGEEKHVSNAKYRYDFNTCTFSYSMAFWTWERWQQEIDWMALHGINAPLNLVGLDVVTRKFLRELKVSESDINAYIAGPGFIAWFAMNNLEGWGGTINSQNTGVQMNGNPDWWYTRQEQLSRNMLQRMRELGMQPVIPGFSGQVPNCIVNYSINGFSSGDVVNNGTWAGGYTRPDILKPNTTSYQTFATVYYKHLHEVMGVSELYSIDPFHEGDLPGGVTNETCYPNIMKELDKHFGNVEQSVKDTYKVTQSPSWMIQYWQGVPQSGAFTAMKNAGYTNRFIGLDLFADNIYAGNAAKWRTNYYDTCPYIYCMLHNFGGRSGLHGRLETTMDGYFQALAKGNNCQGIGATPEGIETNPILYDMLFELPWMDPAKRPTADEWLADYAHARYGVDNKTAPKALSALKNLKKSVWDCKVNQQGTSEAVILARPNWTVGSVSSWSTSAIYWDTQDVLQAADELYAIKDVVTANGGQDGIANYNYDFIDVVRQSMVDYAAQLLPLINAARGNDAEYTRLYQLYLQLMLDLDTMLSYDENFKLERWTSLARNIADEVAGTNENDRNWLEWNARTQVTVWSNGNTDLHDYSNRCWAGLIKDFHYKRWKQFFENNGNAFSGGWYSGFEYPWTVDFNETYNFAGDYSQVVIPTDMTATEKAAQTFGNYFGRVKGAAKNYIFPMGVTTDATKCDVTPEVYRGQEVELPLIIGKNVTITEVKIDLNGDSSFGNGETLTANGNKVTIPAVAKIGVTKAQVTYSDGTVIKFRMALIEDITDARTVKVASAGNGTVAIEGTNELSITTTDAVKMTATANTGYNFYNWTKDSEIVSNDNPFIYYGKDAATFTANFIQDKWGVVACSGTFSGDIASYAQFIHNLTFAYYNREAETIFETTTAPTEIFNTIPQIVNVPQGASFDVKYDNGNSEGLKYCYFRAFIDLNQDGDFDDEGELLKEVGTNGAANTAVCSNKINVLLPYDMPLGITHMRLRFDGAWDNGNKPSGRGAKDASIRPVYEIIINVTEGSDKAAHIKVETNSADWGTVECWTDETPGWTAAQEWDVSANIPMHIKAIPASADVEFLGWYDHYGRLLTTELEYSMLAREDATYTAKFRKALDINGWVFEYRTEPGSEIVTNKLANGVKPEAGKTYYIYAPTRPTNDGEYVNRYLYNNSGTLTLSTTESTAANYLWKCGIENGKYTFQNVADPSKYLKHKGLANAPYGFELGTGTTYYEGITLQSVPGDGETRNLFFVINDNGSDFNQSTRAHNQSTEDYTTDFVFTEVSTPDVVILTNVRKSGNHDLVIPETVEIMGEQCKIVGFANGVFNNKKDLWSITMPKSMEFLSEKSLFSGTMVGTIAPETGAENTPAHYAISELEKPIIAAEGFEVVVKGISNGNTFNQWGSGLFATSDYPLGKSYDGGFQFYLAKAGNFVLKVGGGTEDALNNSNCKVIAGKEFTATINYSNNIITITVDNGDGQIGTYTKNCTINNISAFSAAIPQGITLNVSVRTLKETNPFSGCSNLGSIAFSEACANYYVAQDGDLYNSSNVLICSPEGKNKADAIRNLGTLIDNTKALMDVIATSVDPVGKANGLSLTTQGQDFYVSSNADQNTGGGSNDGGGIAALVDNNEGTYFHTRWGGTVVNEAHYIQVDLGANNLMNNFKFTYKPRNGSPAPTAMTVYGSNDGVTFTDVLATINSGLPAHNSGNTYESAAIDSKQYRYLRFTVTGSAGPGNAQYGGQYFFGMLEFDLFKLTSTVEVADVYKNLASITNGAAANLYDNLVNALYVYNNGGTAAELQAAYNALEPFYTELNKKKNSVLNGVYHINFDGGKLFVGYTSAAITGLSNDVEGYKLFDGVVDNSNDRATAGSGSGDTPDGLKTLHNDAIAAKVAADELFVIVPNSARTGYTISAQGQYLHSTRNGGWAPQLLSADANQAGVYLIEEAATEGLYKLKSDRNDIQYLNDWGPVFGNDKLNKNTGLSIFSFTPVTEYTLKVPANGVTTLCLPFNVVLPEGVTAYEVNLDKKKNYTGYALETVASAGETLAKNTPVIIKATANDYTLAITMDEEGAKHATENNVLRSGLIKTTVAPATTKYAFDGENFNVITVDTEVAANQCWMELSENCGPVIYGGTPAYILTTDEANPVLYKIIIKRAEDGSKVLQYDETSKMVAVANKTDNSSWQAWYFMGDANGITIHPYNADGKKLGATNTSNGAGKVSAVDEATYDKWTFLKQGTEGYFNLRVASNGAYFSHFGGETNKMGFWDGDNNESKTQTDGGSLFKFEEVEFPNDNPRFYQLSDVKAILTDGNDIPAGTTVGLYSNVQPYREACETASDLIKTGNKSASADCYDAYKALRNTKAAITYNEPDESKYYVIKSVANKDYCKGKLVHTNYEPVEHDGSGDTKYDHRHLVFDADAANAIPQISLAVFQFEKTGTTGEYLMKNMHTGLYVKNFAQDDEHMGTEADAQPVVISGYTDGAVTLTKKGDANPMHAQDTHDVIVTDGAEPGNASLWSVEEIAESEIIYKASISNARYSTLFLNYPVTIPDGVEAHTASRVEGEWLKMEKLDGIIPAKTAVVLKGAAGNYGFELAKEPSTDVENIFTGTLYKQTITKEDGTSYYVLANKDNEVGFYNAVNGNNPDQFINAANKAYLPIPAATQTVFYGFRFDNGETTGINGVSEQNPEVNTIYDLQGRKVNNPTKGLYIINGKKVYIK